MVTALSCPGQDFVENSLCLSIGRYTVDHAIRTVIQPLSVVNTCICRFYILPLFVEKGSDDRSIQNTDITVTLFYIVFDHTLRRPVRSAPLIRISMCRHERAGILVYFHDLTEILRL